MQLKLLTTAIALCLLCTAMPLKAQISFGQLQEAQSYALANQPEMQMELLNESKAESAQLNSLSVLMPQVKAISSFDDYFSLPVQLIPAEIFGGPEGEFREVQFGTQYVLSYGLEANMPLINAQAWKNLQISRVTAQTANFKSQNREQRLNEEVARAYYITLLSQQALAVSKANFQANDTLLQSATSKYNNGLMELLEYNRIKALNLESKQNVLDNEATLERNTNTFKKLCGIEISQSVSLTEQLDFQNDEALTLVSNSQQMPEYFMLQAKLYQSELEQQKQIMRYLPEVSAFGRYTRQAQRNEFNFGDGSQSWFNIGLVGIKAEWVLFSGLGRVSSTTQASQTRKITEWELKEYELRSQKELADLAKNYNTAKEGLTTYQNHYQLYQENYRLAVYKFDQGIYSTDQLLQIYNEKLKSQNQYLSKMADYYLNRALINIKNSSTQNGN